MVSDAAATKAPIAKVADKVSGIFVPTVICIAIATMILGIIAVVCMVSCCCTPIAIIIGIAAVICFVVTPKVRGTRGNKAKAGLICGIIGIIGSVILITVFVVNILLSSDFQNEMKEFNTHYDTYIDENDDSI